MGVDWTVVLSAVAGGLIGISGDWAGRFGSRRQHEASRLQAREDAAVDRHIQMERNRREHVEQREEAALERILDAMTQFPTLAAERQIDPTQYERIRQFSRLASYEVVKVIPEDLRRRIGGAVDALDRCLDNELETFELAEVIYIVRHTLRSSIGARLRNEKTLPEPTEDWQRLRTETRAAVARWKNKFRREGFKAISENDLLPIDRTSPVDPRRDF